MRVSDLMSRDVVTIDDAATCLEAVNRMCHRKVRHLPVLDSGGALVGLVTDRDLRHHLFGADVYRQIGLVPVTVLLRTAPVRSVMSAPVRCIAGSAEVAEAAERMRREKVGCLPVVHDQRVVGMLTEIDVLRHIAGAEVSESPELDIVIFLPVTESHLRRGETNRGGFRRPGGSIHAQDRPGSRRRPHVSAGPHCEAVYFVPLGLLITSLDPVFAATAGAPAPSSQALTWGAFLGRNLLPVTIGNVIGGAVLVGLVYWFVRGADRRARPACDRHAGRGRGAPDGTAPPHPEATSAGRQPRIARHIARFPCTSAWAHPLAPGLLSAEGTQVKGGGT